MHYPPYQRCIAVLFIFSLLLQSCRSNSRAVMDESSPHSVTSTPATASIPSMAIGPQEWARYFGEVGEAPPLPADIDKILESPCPFWPAKQVKDTHLLVLVPATVGGEPFTLDLLGELVKKTNKGGRKACYGSYDTAVKGELGTQSPPASYWVLMTRDVLPGSRNQTYDAQKALVAKHASSTGLPYELPAALEAATAILLHHAHTGERLYANRSPYTYTRCREKVQVCRNQYPVVVGGFSSGGIAVNYYDNDDDCFGVSCLRKF
jgi:NLR family CARD domain-containing protein 3